MAGRPFRVWSIARVLSRIVRGRIRWNGPFFLCHLVTGHCNLRCDSCLWRDNASEDLSTEEIRRVYAEARDLGFIANVIWGGEPLFRKDIPEVLRASKAMGFITSVITNGYFLEEKLEDIAPSVDSFIVSIDHPSDKHDEIRGHKGLFARIIRGIELARRRHPRIKIIINFLLTKNNKDVIVESAELAQSLGTSFYVCPMEIDLLRSGRLDGIKAHLKADREEEAEAARTLISLKDRGYRINNSYEFLGSLLNGKVPYTCHFPKVMLQINPNGDVVDCMAWDRPIDNVKRTPLTKIYRHPRLAELAGPTGEACNKCNNPNRIDLSYMWELRREPLKAGISMFVSG